MRIRIPLKSTVLVDFSSVDLPWNIQIHFGFWLANRTVTKRAKLVYNDQMTLPLKLNKIFKTFALDRPLNEDMLT